MTSELSGLPNVGAFAKPMTVLIERVSDAIGAINRPGQIRREAKAKADAALIAARAEVEVSDLQRRAIERVIEEEGKRQANMEAISTKALPLLTADSRPEDLEDDWLSHFFEKCRIVSDKEMQVLWSGILAGQANAPGSFSKRTIEIASWMEKSDAELFSSLCSFVWTNDTSRLPIILSEHHPLYEAAGINFSSLTHLDSMGLIRFNTTGVKFTSQSDFIILDYYGKSLLIKSIENIASISGGIAIFTHAGYQLSKICNAVPREEIYLHLVESLFGHGYSLITPIKLGRSNLPLQAE